MKFGYPIDIPTGEGHTITVSLDRDGDQCNLSFTSASIVADVCNLSYVGLRALAAVLMEAADQLERGN